MVRVEGREALLSRILLVDDHPANLRAFEALLSEPGIEVVAASSGAEALRHLLTEGFAVLLLDVRMPIMDGLETARVLRKNRKARAMPIIFMSADERTPLRVAAEGLEGIVDYCFSPVDPERLRRKVLGWVEAYRERAGLEGCLRDLRREGSSQELKIDRLRDLNRRLRTELARLRDAGRTEG